MSLREKAREIKAAGERQRGNFQPTGLPKRVYEFWLAHTYSAKGVRIRHGYQKENFCHYWRVVMIWAPLLFLGRKVEKYSEVVISVLVGAALLFALYAFFFIDGFWLGALIVLAGTTAVIIGACGMISGFASALSESQRRKNDLDFSNKFRITTFWLGFYTSIPVYLLTKFVLLVGNVGMRLAKGDTAKFAIGLLVSIVLIATVLATIFSGWTTGLIIIISALVCCGILALTVVSSVYISGKRQLAEDREAAYIREHGELPPGKPSRLAPFFRGVGDFIVLLAQVVRVNKWKICPIVEVDTDGHLRY